MGQPEGRIARRALLCITAAALACGGPRPEPADLVLLGGKVVTQDPDRPEATALAVRGGVVAALGSDAEIRRYRGSETRLIDLDGRLAIPGFIESHGHFTGIGRARMNVDLRAARSWDEVVERIAAVATERPRGSWILGWGWHQEKWDRPPSPEVEGYPVHDALSRAVPHHPVLLKHAAGSHAGIVNAHAMERAGIDRRTPDPPGGRVLRDMRGDPTGVLRETAYGLALRAHDRDRGRRTEEDLERERIREIELAAEECLSKGITTFVDAGSDFATVDLLRELARQRRIGLRLWVMLNEDNDALEQRVADYRTVRGAGGFLSVRAIKRSIDGALGSHGAWLLEPYADQPASTGHNTYPLDQLERTARIALEHDLQLCVHAIGDRGNRETLDLFERALASVAEPRDRRWRIEHAQHLSPDDVPRFGELGIIASVQGIHCTSDAPWVPVRLGERRGAEGAYVWRELLDSGATLCNGTDAPVEDVDPVANFHASVTRRTEDGRAFHPEQRMNRHEALRSYTLDAAYAIFEEDRLGSLAPGKLADITVLSRDIMTVRGDEIREAEIVYTIVEGRVLYDAHGESSTNGEPR